jgi:hypothetical protein
MITPVELGAPPAMGSREQLVCGDRIGAMNFPIFRKGILI